MIFTTANAQGFHWIEFAMPCPVDANGKVLHTGIGHASRPKERPDFTSEAVSIRTRRTMKMPRMNRFRLQSFPKARPVL